MTKKIASPYAHTRAVGKLCTLHYALCTLIVLLSFSCRHENDPSNSQKVMFAVDILDVEREDMSPERMPSSSPSDITLEQANMTDLWLIEDGVLLAHQVSTDPTFGSPQVELSYGTHTLTFIASPQSGQQVVDGIWSADKANDAFGCVVHVDVTGTTPAQAVILNRCSYGLRWQSTDLVPAEVKKLRLTITPHRTAMADGLAACGDHTETWNYDVSSRAGTTISVTVYGLPAQYGIEDNITTTIEWLSATDVVLFTHTRTVPVLSNRRTIISGALFNGSAHAAVRVSSQWLEDYETNL